MALRKIVTGALSQASSFKESSNLEREGVVPTV